MIDLQNNLSQLIYTPHEQKSFPLLFVLNSFNEYLIRTKAAKYGRIQIQLYHNKTNWRYSQ